MDILVSGALGAEPQRRLDGSESRPESTVGGNSESVKRHAELMRLLVSAAGGALMAAAFPPGNHSWLVWLGLVPLLWVIDRSPGTFEASLCGIISGLVFWLLVLHPVISSQVWRGWASGGEADLLGLQTRQSWFLHALWIILALVGSSCWALFAGTTKWLTGGRPRRARGLWLLLVAPAAWVLVCEWLRATLTLGFQWGVLANAAADFPHVRQAAAVGGVWLLSALVVAVNVAIYSMLVRRFDRYFWVGPAIVVMVLGVVVIGGALRMRAIDQVARPVRAAALQYAKDSYSRRDFLALGLDRGYATLIRQAAARSLDLLVLPESVAMGVVRLDDSFSTLKPRGIQEPLAAWSEQVQALLAPNPTVLVVGLDTVQEGRTHNSLVAWTKNGFVGRYHKRRLVPFAEYHPRLWGVLSTRGMSQYSPGYGPGIIRVGDLAMGSFICQEIQYPAVIRSSVLAGANLLVSGGNDGVFGDPAVADRHARMAQLRAVESGRFMVRAMKTGISGVIDPAGRELNRSEGSEWKLVEGNVGVLDHRTWYVRLGDLPILLFFVATLMAASWTMISARIVRAPDHNR